MLTDLASALLEEVVVVSAPAAREAADRRAQRKILVCIMTFFYFLWKAEIESIESVIDDLSSKISV